MTNSDKDPRGPWKIGDKVPVACPFCFRVDIYDSLDALCQMVNTIWDFTIKADWRHGFGGDKANKIPLALREKYLGAMKKNKPNQLVTVLKKEGYLTMLCQKCWVDQSQAQYEQAGVAVVKYKGLLFEKDFFENNQDAIRKQTENI